MGTDSLVYQLYEHQSSTYTYIVADNDSKEAAIIDPVIETVDRDLKLIEEMGLHLKYVIDTHIHADHITGSAAIKRQSNAKSAVSGKANVKCADIALEHGHELFLGSKKITALATPGHTDSCMSFLFENKVFTGDALLIRGTGRTDFQQGSSDKLFHSVREELFSLPDDTLVYPAHDYKGLTTSSIGLEKKFNPRLGEKITQAEFKKIMSELNLAPPKKIHEAVPANLNCGLMPTQAPEITPELVFAKLPDKLRLIDVRTKDEFNNELGHIAGAELITLGPELTTFLEQGFRDQEIVFICRSGVRSGHATTESIKLGYTKTLNMAGGMVRWNELNLPVEKN